MKKKKTKRWIIISLIVLLFITGVEVYATKFKFYCTSRPICPWEAYCTGDYSSYPKICKVQCWREEWGPAGNWWLKKSGHAICGSVKDDGGKPPIWPEF